ncbi:MAG: N-acetyltransferase [Desulfurococcales archaeon]|nr:N-acetyltransferase [Desulfurococcales archaeon]
MYVSKKARIDKVLLAESAVVLGESVIGQGSIVDINTIIGYPIRSKIRGLEVGDNNLYLEALDAVSDGSILGSKVHIRPGTSIYEGTVIGNSVETGHNVLIRENVRIGDNTVIGSSSVIDGRVRIGNNVRIESGVYIPPESIIEDNVFLGPFALVTNDRYPMSKKLIGVYIEEGAAIGANAILIAGVKIGRHSIVAAGSIVTRDVPSESVVAGVPARIVSDRWEFERKKREWEEGGVQTWMQ